MLMDRYGASYRPAGRRVLPGSGSRRWIVSAQTAQQTEFRWAFPRWQPPPGNGLVAIVSRAETTRGWVDSLLALDGDRQYVWTGLGGEPERRALEILERFKGVATISAAGADVRQVSLALEVAGWLSRQRAGDRPRVRHCMTSWPAPSPPPGAVRVPHLVSVRHGAAVSDAVVWELLDAASARELLDLPPDWQFFESHLRRLLWLRAAMRTGRLPATPLARRVLELTRMSSTELSIEVVYRNADLFSTLVEAWREVPFGSVFSGENRMVKALEAPMRPNVMLVAGRYQRVLVVGSVAGVEAYSGEFAAIGSVRVTCRRRPAGPGVGLAGAVCMWCNQPPAGRHRLPGWARWADLVSDSSPLAPASDEVVWGFAPARRCCAGIARRRAGSTPGLAWWWSR